MTHAHSADLQICFSGEPDCRHVTVRRKPSSAFLMDRVMHGFVAPRSSFRQLSTFLNLIQLPEKTCEKLDDDAANNEKRSVRNLVKEM